MINCANFQQNISNIDYGFNLETLIILVPGLSLYSQYTQMQKIRDSLEANYFQPSNINDSAYLTSSLLQSREIAKINEVLQLHVLGNMIQMLALQIIFELAPIALVAVPAVALCALAIYQFTDTCRAVFGAQEFGHDGERLYYKRYYLFSNYRLV